jgi:hypothetical protein
VQAAPIEAAPTKPAPSAESPSDAEAQAIAAIKSNPESKVKAFVVYHQRWLDLLRQHGKRAQDYQQKEQAKSHEGVMGAAGALLELNEMGTEAKAAIDKAKAETGLSDQEIGALGELFANAQAQETMQKGVEQLKQTDREAQRAQIAKAIESAPPEVRAELKRQVAEQQAQLEQTQAEMVDAASMKEMRAKYGDAAVDAMLAVTPTLKAQLLKFQSAK